jgi:RnfABCDGE-type electron transport complex B subunit
VNTVIIYSLVTLGAIAAGSAIILFIVAKKFKVEEDPRLDQITELLPGANCGGCGYPGCRGFAEAIIKAVDQGDLSSVLCPAGGPDTMKAIGALLGMEVKDVLPTVAVLRCQGSYANTTKKMHYDGPASCAIAHRLFAGENDCMFGCLKLADCMNVCKFGAITMDEVSGLPVVDAEKCTSCGACVKACPRNLFEIRPKGRKDRRVYVACMNKDKGGVAIKICKAACIGCGKCAKTCPEKIQAITVENFLAYIDPKKCIACGLCIPVCPTKAILATFEPPQPKPKPTEKSQTESTEKSSEINHKQEVNP